jgi:hypothetical protein
LVFAEGRVSEAAAAMVASEAERIADDFERAKAEMEAHLQRLLGVAAVWVSAGTGKQGPLELSARLQSIIAAAQQPLRHDPKWHALLRSLLNDPEATFPPEA